MSTALKLSSCHRHWGWVKVNGFGLMPAERLNACQRHWYWAQVIGIEIGFSSSFSCIHICSQVDVLAADKSLCKEDTLPKSYGYLKSGYLVRYSRVLTRFYVKLDPCSNFLLELFFFRSLSLKRAFCPPGFPMFVLICWISLRNDIVKRRLLHLLEMETYVKFSFPAAIFTLLSSDSE